MPSQCVFSNAKFITCKIIAICAIGDPHLLSMFTLLMGVGKCWDGLMRRFLWKGPEPGEDRGIAPISWDAVCRPVNQEAWE